MFIEFLRSIRQLPTQQLQQATADYFRDLSSQLSSSALHLM